MHDHRPLHLYNAGTENVGGGDMLREGCAVFLVPELLTALHGETLFGVDGKVEPINRPMA